MDLNIIKTLCKKRNEQFKSLCKSIGISDAGLYKAIKKNNLSAEYLERIAKHFNVSVGIFFAEKKLQKDKLNKSVDLIIAELVDLRELLNMYL